MPDNIVQIGLIILLIAPGYACYSIREMWGSYRKKTQFNELLSSIIYSIFVWTIFWFFFKKTPRYYLTEGSLPELITFYSISILMSSIFLVSYLFTYIDKRDWVFRLGKRLFGSIKVSEEIPLIEDIFNDSRKEIPEIHVYTEDGSTYRGINLKGENNGLLVGSHPYCGDISFVCDWKKNPNGEEIEYKKTELIDEKGFTYRTYIPKEKIKAICYVSKIIEKTK